MTLPVLVAVVAIGVSLIVLTVHLTGGTRNAELASAEQAIERYLVDYPEDNPVECRLSADRRDAVIDLGDGAVGLVHAVGSHYLTRHVAQGEVRARVDEREPERIRLVTGDFTWPRAVLAFGDAETARAVATMFDVPARAQTDQTSERAA